MATGSAAGGGGLFRVVFDGCISSPDTDVQRRPYHRNCGCALHKSRENYHCPHSSPCANVSYPIRRTWSEGCLALMASSSGHGGGSPSASPAVTAVGGLPRTRTQLNLCIEE